MTYGDVKTQFSDLLNRRDCTTSQRDTLLQQGFERIQRELRIPAMEKAVQVTTDANNFVAANGLVIPSDYLGIISITIIPQGMKPYTLSKKSQDEVLASGQWTGLPRVYSRRGGYWLLGPNPELGTVIRIDYYAEYPGVSADADENLITIIAPSLAAYAGLSYAGDHFGDKRSDRWEARYQQIKGELEGQGDDDELSGGAAVSAPAAWPDDC